MHPFKAVYWTLKQKLVIISLKVCKNWSNKQLLTKIFNQVGLLYFWTKKYKNGQNTDGLSSSHYNTAVSTNFVYSLYQVKL